MSDSVQMRTFGVIQRTENWLRGHRSHLEKTTSPRSKSGKRNTVNKIFAGTNIPIYDAGKVQGKIKEEKSSIRVKFPAASQVTRSRSKKGFKPLASHLILDLDLEETPSKMTSPISEADKLSIDIDTSF